MVSRIKNPKPFCRSAREFTWAKKYCGDDGASDTWCDSNSGGACVSGTWYSDHCSDGIQDCDETGTDVGGSCGTPNQSPSAPYSLKCENSTNPTGVTDLTPEFKAIGDDPDSNDVLTHAWIQVGTSQGGNDMWDSGWIDISNFTEPNYCQEISYAGTALSLNGTTYYWRIKFKDDDGAVGAWSTETATFTMGTGGEVTTCLSNGEFCSEDEECCSGVCQSGRCRDSSCGIPSSDVSGFKYRRRIRINSDSSSALSDYQIKVTLTTAIMGNPYAHVKSDGSDIRFQRADGTNLPYWIESWDNTGTSIIWVKVPKIYQGDSIIYMYYGNEGASSASDVNNTMDEYEGFESGNHGLFANYMWGNYFNVQSSVKKSGTYAEHANDTDSSRGGGRYSNQNTFWDTDEKVIEGWIRNSTTSTSSGGVAYYFTRSTALKAVITFRDDGNIRYWDGSSHNFGTYTKGNWYKIVVYLGSSSYDVKIYDANYSLVASHNDIAYGNVSVSYRDVFLYSGKTAYGNSYYDEIFSRKYAASEPTVTVRKEEDLTVEGGAPGWRIGIKGQDNTSTFSDNPCVFSGTHTLTGDLVISPGAALKLNENAVITLPVGGKVVIEEAGGKRGEIDISAQGATINIPH